MKYDIVVVGAGIIGSLASLYSSVKNKSVAIIDPFLEGYATNASQDYSKTFRYAYGQDKFYSNMAAESYIMWKELEHSVNSRLLTPSNFLFLGVDDNNYAIESHKTLQKFGYPSYFLNKENLSKKYPQFNASFAIEDQSGCIINAQLALKAVINFTKKSGVSLIQSRVTEILTHRNSIILENNQKISFKKLILTCGYWIKQLITTLPIIVTRQQVAYFIPKVIERFSVKNFPQFAYLDNGFHGFPIFGTNGVKIGNHIPGKEWYSPFCSNSIDEQFINKCIDFFINYLPELKESKLSLTNSCYYDMTPDKDFIIDFFKENVIIGTGFSGHAFKFAPLIGKILANMGSDKNYSVPFERFSLKRKFISNNNIF